MEKERKPENTLPERISFRRLLISHITAFLFSSIYKKYNTKIF